jgi:hypothetical protein
MLGKVSNGSKIKWFIGGNGTVDIHPGVVVGYNPNGTDDRGVHGEIITAVMLRHMLDGTPYLRIQNLRNGAFVWDREPVLNDKETGDIAFEELDSVSTSQLLAQVQKSSLEFVRQRAGVGTDATLDPEAITA